MTRLTWNYLLTSPLFLYFELIFQQSYKTTAEALKKEFEVYAPVKEVKLVYDLAGKPRGYAFVELEDESATRDVYRHMKGKVIDGHEIFLDVERGRTVKDWKPRRLGNVTNTPRVNKPSKATLKMIQQREALQETSRRDRGPPRGGDRGGFRGGDRGDRYDRDRDSRGGSDRNYGGGGGDRDRHRSDDRRDDRRDGRRDDRRDDRASSSRDDRRDDPRGQW